MITDGTFVCGLCGEWLAGCALCGQAPLIDMSSRIRLQAREERQGERELELQSNAIRRAADKRFGY
jgi:hypothetical protein